MLATATTDLLRTVTERVRRADADLARTAARNAAAGVAAHGARRLDDARALRDLAHLGFTTDPPDQLPITIDPIAADPAR
jgi:hypothetical protein